MPEHVAKIPADFTALTGFLRGHAMSRRGSNLPPDVKVIGVEPSSDRFGIFDIIVSGPSLPEVAEGAVIPEFGIVVTVHRDATTELLDLIDSRRPHVKLFMFGERSHVFIVDVSGPSNVSLCGVGRHYDMRISAPGVTECGVCDALLLTR